MKTLAVVGWSFVLVGTAAEPEPKEPTHLRAARQLVKHLELDNTNYAHGAPEVSFTAPYKSNADCSGFVDALLKHAYGYKPEQFKEWFGKERPTADAYHDAIQNGKIFEPVEDLRKARSGDFLAVKYKHTKEKSTGHLMLVSGPPKAMKAQEPAQAGTEQWEVPVIDSARSGHGKADGRYHKGPEGKDHDGLGEGVLRVYTTKEGRVAGYTWSIAGKEFLAQEENNLVIGRLKP